MSAVYMVTITCPETKRQVPTGIVMDKMSYDSSVLENNAVGCPYCGQMHVWSKKDTKLVLVNKH